MWIDGLSVHKRLGLTGNGRIRGCYYKGTFGEKGTCPAPVDKAKSGIKHSILVDGKGYLQACILMAPTYII